MLRGRAVCTALLVLAVAWTPGCASGRSRVTAAWPRADSERSEPKPVDQIVWPLTGTPAPDATLAASPPVAVALSASPGVAVAGLEMADVTYEFPAGATSRLLALFHSHLPGQTGPVATLDPVATTVARQFGARVAATTGAATDGIYRHVGRATYVDAARLSAGPHGATAAPGLAFGIDRAAIASATSVAALTVRYGTGDTVTWMYVARAGEWLRSVNGKPHGPAHTPYAVENIIVLWARANAVKTGGELLGTGRASVFSAGRNFGGQWTASATGAPTFTDPGGAPLRLSPGSTWVEVLPAQYNITLR